MQPEIIKMDKLFITGLSGDGAKTYELWNEFDSLYENHLFKKVDKNGYEIRFFDEEKPAIHGEDIHIGFLTETTQSADGFSTITLPETEYAVFDVLVANGYDSGNTEMDKWLADNPEKYK